MAIINNKKYDPEKARKIWSWNNGCSDNDLDYFYEQLLQKKTGEFFIQGFGGARTQYAHRTGSGWAGGSKIVPLTFEAAKKWGKEYMPDEEYEKQFGTTDEDAEGGYISAHISAAAFGKLSRAQAEQGMSKKAIIEKLIIENL